ncbi:MAG: hypothetical protein RR559_06800 [Bacteroides sp.]
MIQLYFHLICHKDMVFLAHRQCVKAKEPPVMIGSALFYCSGTLKD